MALSARIHIMNCHETPCVSRNEVVVSAIIKVDSANIESRNDKVENLFFLNQLDKNETIFLISFTICC